MKMKIVLGLLLTAVLVVAGQVAWRWEKAREAGKRDPFLQPGEVWTSFDGWTGTRLVLLDDGRYAANSLCDVCDSSDYRFGQWRESSGTIFFVSAASKPRQRVAQRRTVNGCDWLVDVTPDANFHAAFVREGGRCEARLSAPDPQAPPPPSPVR